MSVVSTSRPRVRDPLVLGCVGVTLVVAALLGALVVAVAGADGYDWPEDAVVVTDGQPHRVETSTTRSTLLWAPSVAAGERCSVTDDGGEPVALSPVTDDYHRAGKVEDLSAVASFDAPSDELDVTCVGSGGSFVAVQARPRVPAALAGFSTWVVVPLLLGLGGAGALLGAVGLLCRPRVTPPTRR